MIDCSNDLHCTKPATQLMAFKLPDADIILKPNYHKSIWQLQTIQCSNAI